MSQPVLIIQKDNLGILTLNRPDVFNSFNQAMAEAILKGLSEFSNNQDIRAIMIIGSGKAFCAGQDLQEAISDNFEIEKVVEERYNAIIKKIRTIEKPVVAAINGVAAGAGANIAIACDVAIATKSASFVQAFSKIGLIPDSGGTFTLPRAIGFPKASALMMVGDKISADEADKMGMIYKVFEDDVFNQEVEKLAIKLANMPTKALAYTKQLLNQSAINDLNTQLELEKEYQFKCTQTFDNQEGIQAFIEKRKPKFKGE